MVLKIKASQTVGKQDYCFCGKQADYSIQLTNSKNYCPVCLSCLSDRLNKPGQSFMVKDDYFLQSFKDDERLFITRKIHGSFVSYTVDMNIDGENISIIANIQGEQKAKKAMYALETWGIDWIAIGHDKEKHVQWKEAREAQQKVRKELGLL